MVNTSCSNTARMFKSTVKLPCLNRWGRKLTVFGKKMNCHITFRGAATKATHIPLTSLESKIGIKSHLYKF